MSMMEAEAAEIPAVVARQLAANAPLVADIGARLRSRPPRTVVTCARGSSDHAATYAKYLIETRARIVTASAAPAFTSVYGAEPDQRDCLFIAISQSGRSPDLLATMAAAQRSGAITIALCNDLGAPLCSAADCAIPLLAGTERSVAATKSYLASLTALAQLIAAWTEDQALLAHLRALPAALAAAWQLDWSRALEPLAHTEHLYVIGRGPGLSVARETALKCKETCGLHAEAYSGAEVRHGPLALLGPQFPALILAQDDATRPGLVALATELASRQVEVLLAGASAPGALELPSVPGPADLTPITLATSIYRLLASLARLRGFDPDRPPHLRKVTETV